MDRRPPHPICADVIALPHGREEAIVCLSHLRWDFVFQRPQHLMGRFAQTRTVLYFEEPLPSEPGAPSSVDVSVCGKSGVIVATPRLALDLDDHVKTAALAQMLVDTLAAQHIQRPVLWFYTPMMLPLTRGLDAAAVVYDCMDELANFKFAPPELRALEKDLFRAADVVFTGGYSLFEAKQDQHSDIHPFPSSVDRPHFAAGRPPGAGRGPPARETWLLWRHR
ncbi:hypothetical protein [Brevundimonas sp.]|uniref:hypothetical protein n=1 Tax=Brevundimonas sp. TaxID=1871086 RepID=UPI003919C8D2